MRVRLSIPLSLAVLLLGARLYADDRLDQFFSPGNSAGYTASVEPGHTGSPAVFEQAVRATTVVRKTTDDTWTLSGHASEFHLSQAPVVPETGLVLPDTLWDVQGRLGYEHHLGDRHEWGSSLAIGSASDSLFHSIHETEIQANVNYKLPSKENNAWFFFLSYSNNRTFLSNVPLPGLAYMWRYPDQGLTAILGFPFASMDYRPNPRWSFDASLFGPINQSAEISRRLVGPCRAYVRYERQPLTWLPSDRDDNSNRLIYDEKKALLGLKSPLGHGLFLDFSGGRIFDRRFFEARDATRTGAPQATFSNGWIITTSLSLHWS